MILPTLRVRRLDYLRQWHEIAATACTPTVSQQYYVVKVNDAANAFTGDFVPMIANYDIDIEGSGHAKKGGNRALSSV